MQEMESLARWRVVFEAQFGPQCGGVAWSALSFLQQNSQQWMETRHVSNNVECSGDLECWSQCSLEECISLAYLATSNCVLRGIAPVYAHMYLHVHALTYMTVYDGFIHVSARCGSSHPVAITRRFVINPSRKLGACGGAEQCWHVEVFV